jgi:thioredoxin 2
MVLFHGGREVARRSGAMPTGEIVGWVKSQLG